MMPSYGLGYKLTGNEAYRNVLLDAAASMASRFDERVGMIKANENPTWQYPVLIDTMVSLELLFWAAENGGDPAWKDMAVTHSLNTAKHHIRPDGSPYQVVDFDPATGEPIRIDTLCGLNAESKWMRGVAEGLTGYALAYKYTGKSEILKAAEKLSAFYMANLPDDYIPFWDVSDPAIPNAIRDASAATMAAVGLYELSQSGSPDKRAAYKEVFVNTLKSLTENYLAASNSYGIVDHATWKTPNDPQADTALIWGDYNLLLALTMFEKGM
jgi:unsaturated chondroitin disaccharide hydrolase